MLRSTASRTTLRSILGRAPAPVASSIPKFTPLMTLCFTQFSSLTAPGTRRPQISQPSLIQSAIMRRNNVTDKQREAEARYSEEVIKTDPKTFSATSTVHPVLGEVVDTPSANEVDMGKSIRDDIKTVRETFNLSEVPRQAYLVGLAGVVPYLATSLSTVACAYELNRASTSTTSLMSAQTAHDLLAVLEPLQIGYGAVILSFLGAIHWGLEFAKYGGVQGYPRYAIGVFAPVLAWATVVMPIEYGLITQFLGFTILYSIDTRVTTRGWAPPWYGMYRFVLTFIVGASIVLTLVGRGEIADKVKKLPGPLDRARHLRDHPEKELAKDEEASRLRAAAKNATDTHKNEGKNEASAGAAKDDEEDKSEEEAKSSDAGEDDDKSQDKGDEKKVENEANKKSDDDNKKSKKEGDK